MKNTRALEILIALLVLGNLAALIFCTILLSKFYGLFGAGLPSWVSVGLAVGLAVVAFLTSICATALQGRAGPWPARASTCALLLVWGGVFYAMALTAPPHHVYVVLGLSCFVPVTTLFPGRVLGVLVVLHREFSREEHERTEKLTCEAEARTRASAVRQQRLRNQVPPAAPQAESSNNDVPKGGAIRLEEPAAAPSSELASEQTTTVAASGPIREATEPQVVPAGAAAVTQPQFRPVPSDIETGDPRRASGTVPVDRSPTPQSSSHPADEVPPTGEGVLEEPAAAPVSAAMNEPAAEATGACVPPAMPAVKVRSQAEAGSTTGTSSDRNAFGNGLVSRSTVPQPGPQTDEAGLKESAAESSSTPDPEQETAAAMRRPAPEATGAQTPPVGPAAVKVRSQSGAGRAGAGKASGASGSGPVSRPPPPQTYASAVTLKPKDFLALTGVSRKVFEKRLNLLKALEAAQQGRGRKPDQSMEERLMMRQLHKTRRVNYRQVAQLYGIAETSVSRTVTAINNMLKE